MRQRRQWSDVFHLVVLFGFLRSSDILEPIRRDDTSTDALFGPLAAIRPGDVFFEQQVHPKSRGSLVLELAELGHYDDFRYAAPDVTALLVSSSRLLRDPYENFNWHQPPQLQQINDENVAEQDTSESNELSEEDMQLIDVLWRQDLDLGATRDAFDANLRLQLEREREIELVKEREQLKLLEKDEEEEKENDPWAGVNFEVDGETGENVVVQARSEASGETGNTTAEEDRAGVVEKQEQNSHVAGVFENGGLAEDVENGADMAAAGNGVHDFDDNRLLAIFNEEQLQQLTDSDNLPTAETPRTWDRSLSLEQRWQDLESLMSDASLTNIPELTSTANFASNLTEQATEHSNSTQPFHQLSLPPDLLSSITEQTNSTQPFHQSSLPPEILRNVSFGVPSHVAGNLTGINTRQNLDVNDLSEAMAESLQQLLDETSRETADCYLDTLHLDEDEAFVDMQPLTSQTAMDIFNGDFGAEEKDDGHESKMEDDVFSDSAVSSAGTSPHQWSGSAGSDGADSVYDGVEGAEAAVCGQIKEEFVATQDHGRHFSGHQQMLSNVTHNHTYYGQPETQRMPDSAVAPRDRNLSVSSSVMSQASSSGVSVTAGRTAAAVDEMEMISARDRKRAQMMRLPFPLEKVVNCHMDVFQEMLSRKGLSAEQCNLLKDIRRRGKNKMAAQNCRKRKMDHIESLSMDVESLRGTRHSLLQEQERIEEELREMQEKYSRIYEDVVLSLQHHNGTAEQEYDIAEDGEGGMLLVPTSRVTHDPTTSVMATSRKPPPHQATGRLGSTTRKRKSFK